MEWQELDVFGARYRVAGYSDDAAFLGLASSLGGLATLDNLCSAIVSPASEVCDVGANLGLSALIMAKHVPAGRVYAFEPGKRTFSCLSATIGASGFQNVSIVDKAVGAVSDQVLMNELSDFSAGAHIVTKEHVGHASFPTTPVQMISLDSSLEASDVGRIDLIKIDTEGFEFDVLAGAESTLSRYRPVVFLEMNSWCLMAFKNLNPRTFLEYLLHKFPFVFSVTPAGKLHPIGKETQQIFHFLHEHLFRHGCIQDLVCCWQTDWLEKFTPGLE